MNSCSKMPQYLLTSILAVCVCLITADSRGAEESAPSAVWEPAIRGFEKQDKAEPPPANGILFVGSSTIRLWDIQKHFPGLPVINRGFGGSRVADVVAYADRVVLPYKPRVIVFYSGDNDIASQMTADDVFADYEEFFKLVEGKLPETRLIVLGVKPSVARWKFIETIRALNGMLKNACKDQLCRIFIETEPLLLGKDGQPRRELYLPDNLHLNDDAYVLLSEKLRSLLGEEK